MPERSVRGPWTAVGEFLKIPAIRRIFTLVDVKRSEVVYLVLLACGFALLEGIGLSLLLLVLQYAEGGASELSTAGGAIGRLLERFATSTGLPLNLFTLLVLAFIPIMFRQVAFYWNVWYSALVSNRIATRMRVGTFATMMGADPDFFSERSVGELTGLVLNQTEMAGNTALNAITLLWVGLLIAVYMAILFRVSAPLTLVTVAFAAVASSLVWLSVKRTKAFGERVAEVTQQAHGAVVERLGLVRLVKMRAEEATEIASIHRYSVDMAKAKVKIAELGAAVEITSDPVLMLSAFITLYIGISMMGLKLAQLGMLLFVLVRLNQKVKDFNNTRQKISMGLGSIALVREVGEDATRANTIRSGSRVFGPLEHSIRFDNVTYQYPHTDKIALTGVDAEIPRGSFTAIVGRSGAGKSTLVELLPRLKDVTAGAVLLDGIDVREFDTSELRRGIGYLTQDALLFNDTVRANLTYGLRRVATDAEIELAVERAYAQFVLELPQGLDTVIGDRGLRVSGGERQRIALARVLLEDPEILILDEPTSALDSESEQFIQAALAKLHGSKTILVIAHRLATVVAADQLLVVVDGQIVEQGSHAGLIAAGGAYQKLFQSQLLKI